MEYAQYFAAGVCRSVIACKIGPFSKENRPLRVSQHSGKHTAGGIVYTKRRNIVSRTIVEITKMIIPAAMHERKTTTPTRGLPVVHPAMAARIANAPKMVLNVSLFRKSGHHANSPV